MESTLISVVVPIYNVEKYLSRCVDSICAQTYTNLEIILVDDGSPDNCGKMCDEYAAKDSRIKVIHKENGGLSDARNVAIDVAQGEYLTFVDSDDYVSADYVEVLWNAMRKYDAEMSVCVPNCFYEYKESDSTINSNYSVEKVFDAKEALITMFYQRDFDTSAWGKLYHRALFENIRYPKGILYEDLPTTYRLIQCCKKVAYVNKPNYYYFIRGNSIEGSPFKMIKYESYMKVILQLESEFSQMDLSVQKALSCRIVSFAFHILLDVPKDNWDIRHSILQTIKKYRSTVLWDMQARRKTRVACLLSYCGMFLLDFLSDKGKSRMA